MCAILADPQTNARAGRNPPLKILPQTRSTWSVALPCPDAAARSRPTTTPDASPRCARPSPTLRRRSRPGYAPENRGSDRELLHNPRHHAGRGPADRTREECAPNLAVLGLAPRVAKDPRLKGYQTAIVLAATLLEYARTKPYCYPSNARLADDMGCCISTIRNALTALRAAGWVRLELGSNQPNGRKIWLTWRLRHSTPERREPRG